MENTINSLKPNCRMYFNVIGFEVECKAYSHQFHHRSIFSRTVYCSRYEPIVLKMPCRHIYSGEMMRKTRPRPHRTSIAFSLGFKISQLALFGNSAWKGGCYAHFSGILPQLNRFNSYCYYPLGLLCTFFFSLFFYDDAFNKFDAFKRCVNASLYNVCMCLCAFAMWVNVLKRNYSKTECIAHTCTQMKNESKPNLKRMLSQISLIASIW